MEKKLRISEAAKKLGVTAQTLRNWEKTGRLIPQRSPGGQRYYLLKDIERRSIDLPQLAWAWASSAQAPALPDEYYCERADWFTTRLQKMMTVLQGTLGASNTDIISLLGVVAGEIGDNSFAHNIGQWPDVVGIFFGYDTNRRLIVLADRGYGVRATLQRVRPNISSDTEALRVAFTEIVSGRNPEKRGNGLKVIRTIAQSNPIGLMYRSGLAEVHIPPSGKMRIRDTSENVRGVYAEITY